MASVTRVPTDGQDCHHSKAEFDCLFRQVASRTDITPVAKLVHGALVSLHRTHKSRTQIDIGKMVGLTRHQVWNGLQELVTKGLVLILRVGLGQPNEYVLLGIDESDLRPVRKQQSGQSGASRARTSHPKENNGRMGNTVSAGRCLGCGKPHEIAACPTYGYLARR